MKNLGNLLGFLSPLQKDAPDVIEVYCEKHQLIAWLMLAATNP
jgi:hypothetical protein